MARTGTPFYEQVGRAWLEERYVGRRMAPREIAAEVGVGVDAVVYALQKFDLQGKQPALYQVLDPERLVGLYFEEGLTLDEVGERMGTTADTVKAALLYRGYRLRPKGVRGRPATHGERKAAAEPVVDCWRCRWRGVCLDWSADAPCRTVADRNREAAG